MQKICNFSLINLWCTKNLVDSQYFLGRLFDMSIKTPDYQLNYFTDPFDTKTDIVFLNTCGFISSWRDEADEMVKKLLKTKKTVYLLGCAVQYYKKLANITPPLIPPHGMEREIKNHPSHTKWRGAGGEVTNLHYLSRPDLNTVTLKNIMQWYDSKTFGNFAFATSPRVYTNVEQKFEYLKIAEWCDNHCSFCIIPAIRWKQQSLTIEKVLNEAKNMIANGIKEIILIAQDTTRYGTDLYGKPQLLPLLKKLDKLKWGFTYRLLYLYPDIVTLSQIKELKKLKKFIPYFDIPLQHISSSVLKKMGRFSPQPQKEQVKRSYFWWLRNTDDSAYDETYIHKFLDQIKKIFPIRFIRTNLIIGFPGETKQDFEKLLKFVEETKFDNIALFEYHDEPLAASSKLANKVDDYEIRTRFTKIRQLVNRQLLESEQARKWKEETWYIVEIAYPILNSKVALAESVPSISAGKWRGVGGEVTLVVRPLLHCPEIDSYDEISVDQVIRTYDDKSSLEIWDKIVYIV